MQFRILSQPDSTSCGPTCLHAVYTYYGDQIGLMQVMEDVTELEHGGTLAVFLGCHALRRGYEALIYTYNLQIFDPTWFSQGGTDLSWCLREQSARKSNPVLSRATRGYLEFLRLGGSIRFRDLSVQLLRQTLVSGTPIITGLSATYLYRSSREDPATNVDDPIGGAPSGHFVVLCGYERQQGRVLVADPFAANPFAADGTYHVPVNHLIHSILLGVLTHDANILIIKKRSN